MNKSIRFIIDRISKGKVTDDFPTHGWEDSEITTTQNTQKWIDVFFHSYYYNANNLTINFMGKDKDGNISYVTFKYDPESDFDSFVTSHSVHDGTSLFTHENIHNTILKAMTTVLPNNNNTTFEYAVGDLVIYNKYDDFDINNGSGIIRGVHEFVCLPIKRIAL